MVSPGTRSPRTVFRLTLRGSLPPGKQGRCRIKSCQGNGGPHYNSPFRRRKSFLVIALSDYDQALLQGEHGQRPRWPCGCWSVPPPSWARTASSTSKAPISTAACTTGRPAWISSKRLVQGGGKVVVPTTLNVGSLDPIHPELFRGGDALRSAGTRLMQAALSNWAAGPVSPARLPAGAPAASGAADRLGGIQCPRLRQFGPGRAHQPLRRLHGPVCRADRPRAALRPASAGKPRRQHRVRAGRRLPARPGQPRHLVRGAGPADRPARRGRGPGHHRPCLPIRRKTNSRPWGRPRRPAAPLRYSMPWGSPEAPALEAALAGRAGTDHCRQPRGPRQCAHAETRRHPARRWPRSAWARPVFHWRNAPCWSVAAGGFDEPLRGGFLRQYQPRYITGGWKRQDRPRLRAAGVPFVTDTCTYITPIMRQTQGLVMTNSGKWAHYAPANIGGASGLRQLARMRGVGRAEGVF